MTPQQEDHLIHIQDTFRKMLDKKYRVGQEEHGGDLFAHDALWFIDNALLESIDQVVYLICARDTLIARPIWSRSANNVEQSNSSNTKS